MPAWVKKAVIVLVIAVVAIRLQSTIAKIPLVNKAAGLA